jgi:hypothetical protein
MDDWTWVFSSSQFEEIPDGKKYILFEYVSQNYLQFFFFKLRSAS